MNVQASRWSRADVVCFLFFFSAPLLAENQRAAFLRIFNICMYMYAHEWVPCLCTYMRPLLCMCMVDCLCVCVCVFGVFIYLLCFCFADARQQQQQRSSDLTTYECVPCVYIWVYASVLAFCCIYFYSILFTLFLFILFWFHFACWRKPIDSMRAMWG